MRKFAVVFSCLFAALLCFSFFVFSNEDGKEVTVKGEIVDLACYMGAGEKGVSHKQCAVKCAKMGVPFGILDEKGDVYLILPGHSKKEMQAYRDIGNKGGTVVTVKGILLEMNKISAILVGSKHHD